MTPLFADMTAAEWTTVIGAFFLGLTGLLTAYLQYKLKLKGDSIERKADEAATAARIAKVAASSGTESVVKRLDAIASDAAGRADVAQETLTVAKAVHKLTNGAMREQLRRHAETTRRLASLTRQPADLSAADAAEGAYRDHVRKEEETAGGPPAG